MFIIKLGGSVITNKTKKNSFKQSTMDNLAKVIAKANKKTIIIHGAGSFGHILAKKFKLNEGYTKEEQLHGFSLTHAMVQKLNHLVLNSLHQNGINAVSIPPHAVLKLNNHALDYIDYKIFDEYLKMNFTPVTFGDVVLDKKLGFSICSGDLLVNLLADYFKPEKVIFVMDEDGLYTENPKIKKDAKLIDMTSLEDLEQSSTTLDDHADVTKGMEGKIDTIKNIASIGVETILLNGNKPDRLYDILIGKNTKCTVVRGGQ